MTPTATRRFIGGPMHGKLMALPADWQARVVCPVLEEPRAYWTTETFPEQCVMVKTFTYVSRQIAVGPYRKVVVMAPEGLSEAVALELVADVLAGR